MSRVFSTIYLILLYSICLGQTALKETHYNKTLAVLLDSVLVDDQKYRMQIEIFEKKFGFESNEVKILYKIIQEKDAVNLI